MKLTAYITLLIIPLVIYVIYSGTVKDKTVNKKAGWFITIVILLGLLHLLNK